MALSKNVASFLEQTGLIGRFTGRFFSAGLKPRYEFREFLAQCYIIGYESLPLVGQTGFIMGLVHQCGKLFREDVLTIVWARRFAGYKRPELLISDWAGFVQLVSQVRFPVQVIWAGKPYPGDEGGIAQFDQLIDCTESFANCAVLTGYELHLSGILKRGADVWLNTPRLYHEASGTSGMTAAMNGTINLTIPDGWVPEFARDQVNCFCIPTAPPELAETEKDQWENRAYLKPFSSRCCPCIMTARRIGS